MQKAMEQAVTWFLYFLFVYCVHNAKWQIKRMPESQRVRHVISPFHMYGCDYRCGGKAFYTCSLDTQF